MAKLSEITSFINDELRREQFGSKRFQGRWSGIAELITTSESETVPCLVANNGTTTKLGIDDTYSFEVYHRMIGGSFESGDDFGDLRNRKETHEMVMIVMGDRDRLELTNEQIISGLAMGFPMVLPLANRQALILKHCEFQIDGFDRDRREIWNREFNTKKISLKPNTLLVSLRYSVITEVYESCIEVCS